MNYCPMCGSNLDPDCNFCPNCGFQMTEFTLSSDKNTTPASVQKIPSQSQVQPRYRPQPQMQQQYYPPSNTNGTVALIFGILGFFLIPIIGSIIAIIFGAIARSREPQSSTGKAGLVLGIVGIIFWILLYGFIFLMFFNLLHSYTYYMD